LPHAYRRKGLGETMDIFTGIITFILGIGLIVSFLSRNKPGTTFGPIICSKCHVELRGWRSSGQKQLWVRKDKAGGRVYFCARCRPK